MRRLLSACAAADPLGATSVPRVGVMHVGTDDNPPSLATLVAGLGDLGWFDGPPAHVMQQLIGDGMLVDGRMTQLQGEYDGPRHQADLAQPGRTPSGHDAGRRSSFASAST